MIQLLVFIDQDVQRGGDLFLFPSESVSARSCSQPWRAWMPSWTASGALLGQGQLLGTPVCRVFIAQDQPLLHQSLQHLADGGVADAQVFSQVGHTAAAGVVDVEQAR